MAARANPFPMIFNRRASYDFLSYLYNNLIWNYYTKSLIQFRESRKWSKRYQSRYYLIIRMRFRMKYFIVIQKRKHFRRRNRNIDSPWRRYRCRVIREMKRSLEITLHSLHPLSTFSSSLLVGGRGLTLITGLTVFEKTIIKKKEEEGETHKFSERALTIKKWHEISVRSSIQIPIYHHKITTSCVLNSYWSRRFKPLPKERTARRDLVISRNCRARSPFLPGNKLAT